MINVRRGVFETNSSSVHSICITNNRELDIPENLIAVAGEYGWDDDVLETPSEKLSYLYTGILDFYPIEEAEKYKNYLYEVLSKYTNVTFVEAEKYSYYIDHVGQLVDFLNAMKNEKRLLRFLFSDESFVVTSNDNQYHIKTVEDVLENHKPYKYEYFEKWN